MHAKRLKGPIRALAGLAGVLALAACSADSTTPAAPSLLPFGGATLSSAITVTATVGKQAGDGDSVFVDVANSGSTTAFFSRCGAEPLMFIQQFINGAWTASVQNFACAGPITLGPIAIAPGAHVRVVRVLSLSGHFRFALAAATVPDLKDVSPVTSTEFDIADLTAPAGVRFTATVGGTGADGDSVFVDVANASGTPIFLPRCGAQPLILTQEFSNGVWLGGVQNFACVAPTAPGPISLAPGEHVTTLRIFAAPGRFRFIVSVATAKDPSDGAPMTSNAVDVP